MSLIVDKRIISLSSNHGTKLNGTSNSSVSFYFQNMLRREPDVVYAEVGVISAEIPVSFYTINNSNNTISFAYRNVGTGLYSIDYSITLTNGNYTATTFITELSSKMLSAISGFTTAFLILSISRSTGKLLWDLNATGGGQIVDGIRINRVGSTFYKLLGGDMSAPYFEFFNTANGTLTPFPLNLLGVNKINIQSDNLTTYNYNSGQQGFSNILASVEVDASPYGIILYKNSSLTYNILSIPEVEDFKIELKDVDGIYLDFNNLDWSITLALNLHRTMPTFSQGSLTDVLAIKQKELPLPLIPPPAPEVKAEDIPIIKNDLDLLQYPIK